MPLSLPALVGRERGITCGHMFTPPVVITCRMLLQDACPFRRYHHASPGPRTCLVHRNPGTYVSILTAGSASPPAHSWCGTPLEEDGA